MSHTPIDLTRRQLMASSIVVAASAVAGGLSASGANASEPASKASPSQAAPPPGKPGDFDFLHGEWRIAHRRLKDAKAGVWDEFEGEATCWTILGGVGSVEELRIPARDFAGMGLRLLDVEKKVWSDFWVNARSGVLTPPGMTGGFVDGVGTFTAEDTHEDKPIVVRGVWDRIAEGRCRWHQSVSYDAGKTWEYNWYMEWTRIGPPRGRVA
jgi:hypothetical protein